MLSRRWPRLWGVGGWLQSRYHCAHLRGRRHRSRCGRAVLHPSGCAHRHGLSAWRLGRRAQRASSRWRDWAALYNLSPAADAPAHGAGPRGLDPAPLAPVPLPVVAPRCPAPTRWTPGQGRVGARVPLTSRDGRDARHVDAGHFVSVTPEGIRERERELGKRCPRLPLGEVTVRSTGASRTPSALGGARVAERSQDQAPSPGGDDVPAVCEFPALRRLGLARFSCFGAPPVAGVCTAAPVPPCVSPARLGRVEGQASTCPLPLLRRPLRACALRLRGAGTRGSYRDAPLHRVTISRLVLEPCRVTLRSRALRLPARAGGLRFAARLPPSPRA